MSLVNGANTTDGMVHGSAAGMDNNSSLSAGGWIYPTTINDGLIIIGKTRPTASEGWRLFVRTTNQLAFFRNRATSSQDFKSVNNTLSVDKWWFVFVIADASAVNLYVGDLTTPAAEVSYSATTVGSGAFTADASRNLVVGNNDNATRNGAFIGRIAVPSYWHNLKLSLAEIQQFQLEMSLVQSGSLLMLAQYGVSTGTQTDLSGNGNDGTVVGATVGPHVPIGRLWFPGLGGGLRGMHGGMNS